MLQPPAITAQPQSQTVLSGQSAVLAVTATGSTPLLYQWFIGQSGDTANPIAGATLAAYTTPALTETTSYWVRVSNAAGAADSDIATITVLQPPAITAQPQSQTIVSGQSATLVVAATGSTPFGFQWYIGLSGNTSSPIPAATLANYVTPALTETTSYWVRVSNAAGTADSQTATVIVLLPPQITQQPQSQALPVGRRTTLTVAAGGSEPLSYQWFIGQSGDTANPIPGAMATDYTTEPLTAPTAYWVRVTNTAGAADSQTAMLTVIYLPSLAIQPQSLSVPVGGTAVFQVVATGTGPFEYQWRLNGNNIPGAVNATYTILSVELRHGGIYTVVVRNEAGAVRSDPASLEVANLPLLALADNFTDRMVFTASGLVGMTNNADATHESGEPRHAGKVGGKSLWMTWQPPQGGVATFRTAGSGFDTLLAVYTGPALEALQAVASDDDRGGFLTSELSFNALPDTAYHVAVDGVGVASGAVVLSWTLEPGKPPLPEITQQPRSVLAAENSPVRFTVVSPTPGARYRWFRNGQVLSGEDQPTLQLTATKDAVGTYRARVTTADGQASLVSAGAVLEVAPAGLPVGEVMSADKWQELFLGEPLPGGVRSPGRASLMGFTSITLGVGGIAGGSYADLWGSTGSPDDPADLCGVVNGVSRWFRFRTVWTQRAELTLSSDEISAVMRVYKNAATFVPVTDCVRVAKGSSVTASFHAQDNVDYLVLVAGEGNQAGQVRLDWKGVDPADPPAHFEVKLVQGRLWLRGPAVSESQTYALDWASELGNWQPLVVGVLPGPGPVVEYHDTENATQPQKYFRIRPSGQ